MVDHKRKIAPVNQDTNQQKWKPKWITSYSNMSIRKTEKRLGFEDGIC